MKNTMKKLLSLLLVVMMLLGGAIIPDCGDLSHLSVQAASAGTCGTDLTWEITDGVLTISGNGAMKNWSSAASSPWYNSSIKKVVLEDGVTSIGNYAFASCSKLTEIEFADSVKKIGSYAFIWCTGLTDFIIPDSIETIGQTAFQYCKNLRNITIGSGLERLGSENDGMFIGCDNLEAFEVVGNTYFSSDDGVLFSADKTELICYPRSRKRSTYSIPAGVLHIGYEAFYGCKLLTEIEIPSGVLTIGYGAFEGCDEIEAIDIPSSVESIDDWAFYSCDKLNNVVVPAGVAKIGGMAFGQCGKLRSITILNPKCDIFVGTTNVYDGSSTIYSKATIYGYSNSSAQAYAEKYSRKFVSLGGSAIFTLVNRYFENNLDYYTTYWDSSSYNAHLANMLACLSKASYSEYDINNTYTALGFELYSIVDFDADFDPSKSAYAFGFKKSANADETICLIAVRGSVNVSDWIGNFDIATQDEKHDGFAVAANNIYNDIEMLEDVYRKTGQISGDIKYVITGHSRGAAVANLLAVQLQEEGVSAENIYNYNFACPDVACKSSFPEYNNIFNLCNREDPVPFVPGTPASAFTSPGTSWGKYGQTYWFTKDEEGTINPFKDHSIDLYLEHFDKRQNPDEWGATYWDRVDDALLDTHGWLTKVLCPVDVVITDVEGNNVASVINGEINYYDSIFGNVIILTDGDKKVIYTHGDRNFNVHLIGTDTGEMTYSVEKFNFVTGETFESKTFENIQLKNGKEMYSPVGSAAATEEIELFVVQQDNGVEINTHKIASDGTETEINHIYVATIIAPTCTEQGFTLYTCSNCDDNYKADYTEATSHADENQDGSCDACGEVLEQPETPTDPEEPTDPEVPTDPDVPTEPTEPEDPEIPDEPTDDTPDCSCLCHSKNGFMQFVYKLVRFFWQLFGMNMDCACGSKHFDFYFFG